MKACILFFILFSLLIIGINTESEIPKIPKKCEDYFNVSTCSECQKELWDSWSDPSSCGFFIRLITNIIKNYSHVDEYNIHDTRNFIYNEAVEETCDENFSCTYDEAESLWERVEKKCSNELTAEVDWSADPLTLNRTVSGARATAIFYYFGIPDHDFMCRQASSGELCGIEITKPLIKWLEKEIPEGNFRFSFDHQFVYKEDGSRLEIPRELYLCGECQKKKTKIYKYWIVKHPLPDYIKDVFGFLEDYDKNFTCPNDGSKTRRTPNRLSRRKIN